MLACYGLGTMYGHSIGADGDLEKAAGLMVKACNAGIAPACYELANAAALGTDRDLSKAAELYRRACRAGSRFACKVLGSNPS
jgi:TPR repeat protein